MGDSASTVRPHLSRPHLTAVNDGTAATPPPAAQKPKTKEEKKKPTKKLPTDRLKFQSQLDIIRAYGSASQNGTRAVNYKDVAKLIKMDPDSVTLMSVFLVENGFVERAGNDLLPSKALVDFALAHTWSSETASKKLGPLVKRTWFGQVLCNALSFRAQNESEAITELAHEISAGPEYKNRIKLLVDYVESAGLIRRDNGQLSLAEPISDAAQPAPDSMPKTAAQNTDAQKFGTAGTATGFANTEGTVQFHVSIRVSMAEMAGWTPERISAFFAGLAQVLAAKKGAESLE